MHFQSLSHIVTTRFVFGRNIVGFTEGASNETGNKIFKCKKIARAFTGHIRGAGSQDTTVQQSVCADKTKSVILRECEYTFY